MLANPEESGDSKPAYVPARPRPGETFQQFLGRRQAEHAAEEQTRTPVAKKVAVPFPYSWAGTQLPAPNIMLRSALFSVARGRRKLDNETLASQKIGGYAVIYDGARLDQFDFDVWLVLVSVSRDFGLGGDVPISLRGIAERIGIGSGGKDIERVRRSLNRMVAGLVILRAGPRSEFRGHLVSWFDRIDDHYQIRLNERLAALFAPAEFTLLMSAERMGLDSALCKWLHGFYSTQSQSDKYPYLVETLRDLCGSETRNLFHFRAQLKEALTDLKTRGIISEWSLDDDDLVRVKRKGSDSQQRAVRKSEARANRVRLAQMQRERDGERGSGLRRL